MILTSSSWIRNESSKNKSIAPEKKILPQYLSSLNLSILLLPEEANAIMVSLQGNGHCFS